MSTTNLKMFTDDIKIYRAIHSTSDSLLLQQDLDKLSVWAQKWLLKFTVPKCVVLPLGNSGSTDYNYYERCLWYTDKFNPGIPS